MTASAIAPQPVFSATRRQMEMLRYIAGYQARNGGRSPSYREVAIALKLDAISSVHRMMIGLQVRGYLQHSRGASRAIEILHAPALPRDASGEPLYFVPADRFVQHGAAYD